MIYGWKLVEQSKRSAHQYTNLAAIPVVKVIILVNATYRFFTFATFLYLMHFFNKCVSKKIIKMASKKKVIMCSSYVKKLF